MATMIIAQINSYKLNVRGIGSWLTGIVEGLRHHGSRHMERNEL